MAIIHQTLHRARRAAEVLRTEGVGPVLAKIIARIRLVVGLPDAHQRAFLARKAAIDAAFDTEMGTDTGGIQTIPSLTIVGDNAHHGVDHIASDPGAFDEAIAALDIPFQTAKFLDLGAGKGRALLLAARYPFASIRGVEFGAELHAAAIENIRRAGADPRISVDHGDAAETEFPGGPLVIFMYNPFDAPIVRRVADNAMESWRTDPRPVRILYLNPRCANAVAEAGWVALKTAPGHMLFAPPD